MPMLDKMHLTRRKVLIAIASGIIIGISGCGGRSSHSTASPAAVDPGAAAVADARDRALRVAFEKCGVDVVELATEDDVLDALMRFAQMRKQSLRRSA